MTDERLATLRKFAADYPNNTLEEHCQIAAALPSLLTLLDEQKKRIEELEVIVAWVEGKCAAYPELTDPTVRGKSVPRIQQIQCAMHQVFHLACAKATYERIAVEAEARASRAEQATVKALHKIVAADVHAGGRWSEWGERATGVADLLDDAIETLRDALSSLPTPPQTQKWIPVGERLPEKWKSVLVWSPGNLCTYTANIGDDGKWQHFGGYGAFNHEVTHWQPLPTPPEEEKA